MKNISKREYMVHDADNWGIRRDKVAKRTYRRADYKHSRIDSCDEHISIKNILSAKRSTERLRR